MQELHLLPELGGAGRRAVDRVLKETSASFSQTLKQAVQDVNALQGEAGKAIERMVSGEATDMHEVMIAVEKAKTSFELLMEIRNKAIDAYREIMRMQV
jgi:flagellar hook-basal body complex protein FliE